MGLDLKRPSKRDQVFQFRLRDSEARLVDAARDVTGLSRSDFGRRVLIHEAQKVLLGASQDG